MENKYSMDLVKNNGMDIFYKSKKTDKLPQILA